VKVDESNVSVCCCPMESIANANEPAWREWGPNINGRKQVPGWSNEKLLIPVVLAM